MRFRYISLFAICAALAAPAASQDFDDGLMAAEAGDFTTALENWLPLAERGDALAQANLGVMYHTGRGVPQDYVEAVRWYRLAADQGDARAQTSLGEMYEFGRGVPQDSEEAARLYRLAADQGDTPAQTNLGVMYELGRGVLQDYVLAHMWLNIANANGAESGPRRDTVAEHMTREQIADAQARARVCMSSGYQDCD